MLQYSSNTVHQFMLGISGLMCALRRDIREVSTSEQPLFLELANSLSDSLHNLQWLFEPQRNLERQLHSIDYHIGALTIDLKSLSKYRTASTVPINSYEHCLKTLGQSITAMKNEVLSSLGEEPVKVSKVFTIHETPLSPNLLAEYARGFD